MKKYLLFLLTVFNSCLQDPTDQDNIYIVPVRNEPKIQTLANEPPPPPPIQVYNLPFDFIIDSAGQVYFFQQQQFRWICGTGRDWNTPPEFIDLQPKDLVQVPIESIEDFIKLNITTVSSAYRRVSIASLKDTVNSAGLSRIIKVFKDTTNKIKWVFRKATQEETIVLGYKQQEREYYSDEIKWDSTRILFVPNLGSDFIKFTPPKVEEE